jgi:hypothetical protein
VILNREFLQDRALTGNAKDTDPFPKFVDTVGDFMAHAAKHHHSLAIVNSCGTGKTQAAVGLCQRVRAVYVGLRQDEIGSPRNLAMWSLVYHRMFLNLRKQVNFKDQLKAACKIIYSFVVASAGLTPDQLFLAQFGETISFSEKVWQVFSSIGSGNTPSRIKEILSGQTPSEVPVQPANSETRQGKRVQIVVEPDAIAGVEPLLIILDDAMVLMMDSAAEALRSACTQLGHFVLFISKALHPGSVIHGKYTGRSQPRSYLAEMTTDREDYPPLHNVGPLNMYWSEPWHPFTYGRPLWRRIQAEANSESFVCELVTAARRLLTNSTLRHMFGRAHCLALFGVRFSLTAAHPVADDLVENHMAIVESVERKGKKFIIRSCYRPEPVLAEVACRILWEPGVFGLVLDHYFTAVGDSIVKIDFRDIGKVMAAVYLSAALDLVKMDAARITVGVDEILYSAGVDVRDFISKIGGELNAEQSGLLNGYLLNFTHVYRPVLADASSTNMHLTLKEIKSMYYRCSAIYSPFPNFQVIDIVLPMMTKDGRVGLLLVQAKNEVTRMGSDAGRDFLAAMVSQLVVDEPVVCIRIFCNMGKGGAQPPSNPAGLMSSRSDQEHASSTYVANLLVDIKIPANDSRLRALQQAIVTILRAFCVVPAVKPPETALADDVLVNQLPVPKICRSYPTK